MKLMQNNNKEMRDLALDKNESMMKEFVRKIQAIENKSPKIIKVKATTPRPFILEIP